MTEGFDLSFMSEMELVIMRAQLKKSSDPTDAEFLKSVEAELKERERNRNR